MAPSRQLAAIMFTDIIGYNALMETDEQNALGLLNKGRQIQQSLIESHGGKWIKAFRDGDLASFNTATEAVQTAILIQRQCKNTPGLDLRIGIHLGEVMFENNDAVGDGVNIATMLTGQATAGGICISGSVHDNVANKNSISTVFLREEKLKYVNDPVKIYQVIVDSVDVGYSTSSFNQEKRSTKLTGRSIAVLPFVNMSNDPEQEYFSDGMSEEILNSLTHIKDLKVSGHTSSFQFKGKKINLQELGEKLNVSTVLEGSIRKQGNRVRITVQLMDTMNGYNLWSERYDREIDDIFAIQDEIALAITEKLEITLRENEKAILYKKPTANHEAYDLYLKGRFYFNKRGGGILKGLDYFEQALKKDPELTLAYAGMADAYCMLSLYCVLPPHLAMPKAKINMQKRPSNFNRLLQKHIPHWPSSVHSMTGTGQKPKKGFNMSLLSIPVIHPLIFGIAITCHL